MQDALGLAALLANERTPFVLATVVWRRGPSSGREGAKAVITADGQMSGWLGGACAEPTVISEALDALVDGQSRLLQLGPSEDFGTRQGDRVISVPMACESEGAMEVYLEPAVPAPQLVVIGRSPGAETLARMAEILGWHSVLVDDGGGATERVGVGDVVTSLDLPSLDIGERDFIVIATQGNYDEQALEAALATSAGYIGLVASRKRAASVLEFLRVNGVDDGALARIHAPAGLDLGSLPNREIAVAVLAEMVALQAGGGLTTGVTVAKKEEAIDPVCEMIVDVESARWTAEHAGATYYFCAPGCRTAFEKDPASFVG
ncbi:MAG: XdhC family protein [Acidimicrobiia bacterium]|nr:XdhC family protein [Acidimicrobiia bacterium]